MVYKTHNWAHKNFQNVEPDLVAISSSYALYLGMRLP